MLIDELRRHVAGLGVHIFAMHKEIDDLDKALDSAEVVLRKRIKDCI